MTRFQRRILCPLVIETNAWVIFTFMLVFCFLAFTQGYRYCNNEWQQSLTVIVNAPTSPATEAMLR